MTELPAPEKSSRLSNAALALSIIGSCAVGVIAIVMIVPAFYERHWLGIAVMLLAAAMSFGLLANAILRR
jgi:hypothetical protein